MKQGDEFSWKEEAYRLGILSGLLLLLALPDIVSNFFNISFYYQTFEQNFLNGYQASNPPIFFSIGEVLATIAVLAAIYQFKKEDWEIALEVKRHIKNTVFVLVILGFTAITFSALVSFISPTSLVFTSLFWQLIATLCVAFSIPYLLLSATNKNLFTKETARPFTSALLRRVSSRNPNQIDEAVNALAVNFKVIAETIKSLREDQEITEFERSAYFVMTQIISNPHFAHHVVKNRADFLEFFLRTIKKQSLTKNTDVKTAFSALAKALLNDQESYLYNEIKHSGPGIYYKPFLTEIFSDVETFNDLEPFSAFEFEYGEKIDPLKLKLFLDATEIAVEAYFKEKRNFDFEHSHYHDAFELAEKAFARVVEEARNYQDKNLWPVSSKIHDLTFFVGWRFKTLYTQAAKEGRLSDRDINVAQEKLSFGVYPKSLTAGYAELLFKLLCELSSYPERESIRHYAITLTDRILWFRDEPEFNKLREVLLEYIWEKVEGTSGNIHGYYPIVLPTFLSLSGMWQDTNQPERKALYNRIVELLNTHIKPKIISGETMADDETRVEDALLPPEIVFNREKDLFQWKMSGKGASLQDMVLKP